MSLTPIASWLASSARQCRKQRAMRIAPASFLVLLLYGATTFAQTGVGA